MAGFENWCERSGGSKVRNYLIDKEDLANVWVRVFQGYELTESHSEKNKVGKKYRKKRRNFTFYSTNMSQTNCERRKKLIFEYTLSIRLHI